MQREKDVKYLWFPIRLLQREDIKEVLEYAFDYGIIHHSKNFVRGEDLNLKHIEEALKDLEIKGDAKRVLAFYVHLWNNYKNEPITSITVKKINEFYCEPKTNNEILVFRAYCALKSIVGEKSYMKVTNEYLLARMFGFRCVEDMKSDRTNTTLNELKRLKPKTLESRLGRIKDKLKSWYVTIIAKRGVYVSFKMGNDELQKVLIQKKEKSKDYNKGQC